MNSWKNYFRIGFSAFIVYLGIHYWDGVVSFLQLFAKAGWPIFFGAVIAYVINILMEFLERQSRKVSQWLFQKQKKQKKGESLPLGQKIWKKMERPICLLGAYLLIVIMIYLIISMILPELTHAIQLLIKTVPETMDKLMSNERVAEAIPEWKERYDELDWGTISKEITKFLDKYGNVIASGSVSAVTTVFEKSVNFVLSIIFSIYVLLGKERLVGQVSAFAHRYLPKKIKEKADYVLQVADRNFHNFIVGQCTDAVILGALCALGMLIFGFPYAGMIGVLVGATALIPIAGAFIGAGVGAILIFTISPTKALLFILFIIVLQQLEENLIYPKVVGDSIGLPGIWVLAAITLGGGVYGITGMLLGVPIVATVYQIIREDVSKGQDIDRKVEAK